MPKFETLRDLLEAGEVSKTDLRKVAAALWRQNAVATRALTAPYSVTLPDFNSLAPHVQDFIIKGMLDATVEVSFRQKRHDDGR